MKIIYIKFDGKKHHLCAEVVLSLKMVFYDIWIWAFRCGRLTVYLRFSPARSKLLQPQQRATGYPRFRQLGSEITLKIDAVAAANQKSLMPSQQEVMCSAGFIHQPDTLVTAQGRSPDSDTHALHRFIGLLANRLKQQNTSNDDVC